MPIKSISFIFLTFIIYAHLYYLNYSINKPVWSYNYPWGKEFERIEIKRLEDVRISKECCGERYRRIIQTIDTLVDKSEPLFKFVGKYYTLYEKVGRYQIFKKRIHINSTENGKNLGWSRFGMPYILLLNLRILKSLLLSRLALCCLVLLYNQKRPLQYLEEAGENYLLSLHLSEESSICHFQF